MARPTGWDILGLDGDPTPGVVESVQALAKEFGDFAHDVESAYRSLNSFGADTTALQWVGQTADAFKSNFGPLPGRLQKLYTSYSEASDALSAYAPQLQAAQSKADSALRQAQDAEVELQRANTNATTAAADLKTAQQNHTTSPNPQAVTDAQTAHDTAQTNLNNAKARMAALTTQANQAHDDRITAAKACASALHHAQSDGIHNKHWWEHLGADLAEWGGKIAEIANDLAPFLDVLALATSWIPGVDVITAGLAEADNLIALAGTGLQIAGDAMQGHWGDALMGAGMLGATFLGGKALGALGGKVLGKLGTEAEGEGSGLLNSAEKDVGGEEGAAARVAEGNEPAVCETDPVDVVSGWMLSHETDLELPGVMSVVLRRAYASGYQTGRLFGPGWSSTLDQRISVNEAGVHFAGDDAQRLDYPMPGAGQEVLPERGERWPLVWDHDTDEIRIVDSRTGQTRHFGVVHYRDDSGQIRDLTAISDRNGNRITIERDEFGTPTALDHLGYRVLFETVATAAGPRVAALRLADGRDHVIAVKDYLYDERGRLTGVIDSSGVPFTYEYDAADRITAWIDRLGYRYSYDYDPMGRVIRGHGADGSMTGRFVYNTEASVTIYTDSFGDAKQYHYDENGHIRTLVDQTGAVTRYEHDRHGRVLARVDALGNTTRILRDENGDVVRVEHPDGTVLTIDYDERLRRPVRFVDPDDAVWQYTYDEAGNVTTITDPAGALATLAYDSRGRLIENVDALGNRTIVENDAAGLPIAVTTPGSARTVFTRNAFGRPVEFVGPDGCPLRVGWTVEGRPAWRLTADGVRSTWEYDAGGNLRYHRDSNGGVISYEYGSFGKAVARTGADGARYAFAYDTELRLVSVTNGEGGVWRYDYDAAGRLVRETDFGNRTVTYDLDAMGRIVGRVNGAGQGVRFERDAMGRVSTQIDSGGGSVTYGYDKVGRLTSAVAAGSSMSYTRDPVGLIIAETVDGQVLRTEYDAVGRPVRRVTPAGAVSSWSYNAEGRPLDLVTGAGALSFGYDLMSRETSRRLGPAAALTQTFDELGRLTGQEIWAGDTASAGAGTLVQRRSYSYRADGVPTAVGDLLRGDRAFTADAVGRVTAVQAEGWRETYAYDATGNLRDEDLSAAAAQQTVAADTRITGASFVQGKGRTRYERDAQGRVVSAARRTLSGQVKTWTYEWDPFDRLLRTVTPEGEVWQYSYDPIGRRTAKHRVDAQGATIQTTRFVWEGSQLVEQTRDLPGGGVESYTWDYEPGTHRVAAQTRRSWVDGAGQEEIDSAFHAIVTDLVGTPQELITPDGRVAWHTVTSLWGRSIADPDAEAHCPLRFPGQYHDEETGWNYNYFRHYDPDTAAYSGPDPLGLRPAPNDHAYVVNPLVGSDPLGLAPCYLTQTGPDTYTSPGGLEYGPDTSPSYASRVDHVLNHNTDIPNRAQHGVFCEPDENQIFKNIDEAYTHVQSGNSFKLEQGNGYDVHYVNMNRPVGLIGGVPGAASGNPTANYIQLILRRGTNQVITAYPVRGIPM
jgi:RHS repeat-associated protein